MENMMKTSRFFATTALVSLLIAAPAFAQNAPEGADAATDEIIVTATKREQTLQEIPVAVSVTTGETIERAQIRDIFDLQTVVPSLRVEQLQSSANTNFIIRGFGNGANNAGNEPSVGIFIDGVYRSRAAAQIGDLPNVSRIEVLRGPQSTLFGKNASTGVISVITKKPQFDFGGSAALTYGNYNTIVAKADVTGPITNTIAFSLSGNYNARDGYARDLKLNKKVNDRNRWGVRGDLLFAPSSDLSVRLIADYDKIDENCCVAANVFNGPTGPAIFGVGGKIDPANPFSYNVFNNRLSQNNIKNYGFSGQIDYALGAINLTSITAYRGVRSGTEQDSDFTSADIVGLNRDLTNIKTFTQELRLASDFDGPVDFLVGGYYFNEKIRYDRDVKFGADARSYFDLLVLGATGTNGIGNLETALAVPAGTFQANGQGITSKFQLKDNAYSLFGQVDFEPFDGFVLTGGLNYTNDKKKSSAAVTSTDVFSGIDLVAVGVVGFGLTPAQAVNPAFNPLLGLRAFQAFPQFLNYPNAVESGRIKDDKLTYTLRAAYAVSNNFNVYASYSTGFKASSVNLNIDSRPSSTDFIAGSPVTSPAASPIRTAGLALPNLTTGSRFARPENSRVYEIGLKAKFERVAFNLTAFDQQIKGFQSNAFTGLNFALTNAGSQTVRGIEFDSTVSPIDPLVLSVAFTYLDPIYDSFTGSIFGNLTGTKPANIPDISMTLGAAYTHEFASGSKLIGNFTYSYESEVPIVDGFVAAPAALARSLTRQTDLIDASLTLALNSGFELSVYGRNLLNDKYLTTVFDTVIQDGSISGYPSIPRTYGVSARFKF
jgi:iron complex outermembrane recepter protein